MLKDVIEMFIAFTLLLLSVGTYHQAQDTAREQYQALKKDVEITQQAKDYFYTEGLNTRRLYSGAEVFNYAEEALKTDIPVIINFNEGKGIKTANFESIYQNRDRIINRPSKGTVKYYRATIKHSGSRLNVLASITFTELDEGEYMLYE